MIKQTNGKIGLRELISLSCITIGFKITDMTATIIFQDNKNAGWIVPIISIILIIGPLFLLVSLLKKYKDKNLVDLIYTIMGKYLGFIICFLLFVVLFISTAANSRNYIDIMNTMFLTDTPVIVLYVLGFLGSYFIANRGFENIARTSWFFFIVIKVSFLLVIVFSLTDINLDFLYPLQGPGIKKLIHSGVRNTSIFAELFIITVFYPYLRSHRDLKLGNTISMGIAITELTLFYIIYISVFDYPPISDVAFPFHQLTMFISTERFFTGLEAFFIPFWVIGATIRYAFYLYATTVLFGYTMKIKEFEPLLLPFTALIIMVGMIFENPVETILFFKKYIIMQNSWLFLILLPVALWIIDKVKGDRKK